MNQHPSPLIEPASWRGRRVLVTGHTGFKGAWLCLCLRLLGAKVAGLALPPLEPSLFDLAELEPDMDHAIGDIRDPAMVQQAISRHAPELVIHMAAQPLVRAAYADPVATYATNVLGTVHVLEAVRHAAVRPAVIMVTSDKCYAESAQTRPLRETDPMGGEDPYSSSKGCAELVVAAWRHSFMPAGLATVRAGNAIGGGDWAADRLVPDAIAAFAARRTLPVRHPASVRPWQHVLDPLLGYLHLAARLLERPEAYAEAWNFGPQPAGQQPVAAVVAGLARRWGDGAAWAHDAAPQPPERAKLVLDSSKAAQRLGWQPRFDLEEALDMTVAWYRAWIEGRDMRQVTEAQIAHALGSIAQTPSPSGRVPG